MIGLMITMLVVVLFISLVLLSILGALASSRLSPKATRQVEVERAEWRLHQLASAAFQSMLDEARRHGRSPSA